MAFEHLGKVAVAVAALAAVLALPAPVGAQDVPAAQARARLGSLGFTIYDARPDDDVAPSFQFLDVANAWRSQLYFDGYTVDANGNFGQDVIFRDRVLFTPPSDPLALRGVSVGVNRSEGFGVAGGAWTSDTVLVGAQGQAWNAGLYFDAFSGLSTTATGNLSPTFFNLVLGAGTGVRIRGYGITEAWLSASGEYASARVELFSRFSSRAADGSYQDGLRIDGQDSLDTWIHIGDPVFLMPHDSQVKYMDERWLSLTHENLSDVEQIGRVRFAAYASGNAQAAPVPGPAAWLLLLAGLPLAAWLARRKRMVGLAAGLTVGSVTGLPAHAQPSAEQLEQSLKGVWLVQIGRSVGALHVTQVAKSADGFSVDATYSNARAKLNVDVAAVPLKIELTTAAGTVMRLSESKPGTLSGTFSARSGSGDVMASRFVPKRDPDIAARCGLSEGLWAGTWANGNLGAWTLWLGAVGADCSAAVRYGAVNETVTVQPGGFAFVCNPNTGGTCTFKPSGKELWVAYSNSQGGRNNAVFKPVE